MKKTFREIMNEHIEKLKKRAVELQEEAIMEEERKKAAIAEEIASVESDVAE